MPDEFTTSARQDVAAERPRFAKSRRRRSAPEDTIHINVIRHLKLRGVSGLVFWHTPNDGKRSYRTAARFRRLGMRAGVSDLILVHDGRIHALELKAPGNTATAEQSQFLADMEAAGAFTCVATGLDRAIAVLEMWGLLRGRKQ